MIRKVAGVAQLEDEGMTKFSCRSVAWYLFFFLSYVVIGRQITNYVIRTVPQQDKKKGYQHYLLLAHFLVKGDDERIGRLIQMFSREKKRTAGSFCSLRTQCSLATVKCCVANVKEKKKLRRKQYRCVCKTTMGPIRTTECRSGYVTGWFVIYKNNTDVKRQRDRQTGRQTERQC